MLKRHIPCQAVHNKLLVDEIPSDWKNKGAICTCNVPVDCDQTCSVLPRPSERSGIIMLKLKRKLSCRGHVYFQAV